MKFNNQLNSKFRETKTKRYKGIKCRPISTRAEFIILHTNRHDTSKHGTTMWRIMRITTTTQRVIGLSWQRDRTQGPLSRWVTKSIATSRWVARSTATSQWVAGSAATSRHVVGVVATCNEGRRNLVACRRVTRSQ